MPVKSIEKQLQERGIVGNFPRVGKYRKGTEKPASGNAPGRDQEYFRLTLEPQYEFLREHLDRIYGEQPREFKTVFLAADSADSAFQYWREDWTATKLLKRCDEETIVSHFDEGSFRQSNEPLNCTCDPFNRTCGLIGRLDIVPVQACEESGFWFKLTVETHSVYDCAALRGYMIPVEAFMSKIPNVAFWSVPFVVGRAPRKVPVTMTDKSGKKNRSIKEMSLLYLYVDPEYNNAVLAPMLSAPAQALLEAGADLTTGELPEIEISQEASWDREYVKAQTLYLFAESGDGAEYHQINTIAKMVGDGDLTDDMTDAEAIDAIKANRASRDAEKASGNASKTSKKGSNSSAAQQQVQTPADWLKDAQRLNGFIHKAHSDLGMDMGSIMEALKVANEPADMEDVQDFTGSDLDAWAACVAWKFGYSGADLWENYAEDSMVAKAAQKIIDARAERLADIPF